jgi:hypothetical protein
MSRTVGRWPEVPPPPGPPPHQPHIPVVPPPPLMPHVDVPQVPVFLRMKWEYKRLTRGTGALTLDEAELNALGGEGWELVAVLNEAGTAHFYFKRQAR